MLIPTKGTQPARPRILSFGPLDIAAHVDTLAIRPKALLEDHLRGMHIGTKLIGSEAYGTRAASRQALAAGNRTV